MFEEQNLEQAVEETLEVTENKVTEGVSDESPTAQDQHVAEIK